MNEHAPLSAAFRRCVRRVGRTCVLGAAVLALGACGLSRPSPERQSYLLNVPPVEERAKAPPGAPVLRINRFTVAQPFDGKGLVYRATDTRYEADFYHQFLAFPATLVTENAMSWLATRGLFAAVVPSGSTLDSSHVLEAAVPALYGDFRGEAAAVLSIRFLLARDDGTGGLLYDRLIERRVPLAARTPDALVRGLDAALAQILGELDADLRKLDLAKSR
jgi:uncharacterized lipoprotein YmbA